MVREVLLLGLGGGPIKIVSRDFHRTHDLR